MSIEQIRFLIDAATRGPWESNHAHDTPPSVWDEFGSLVAKCYTSNNDAKFVANARTLMPLLLDVVEAGQWLLYDPNNPSYITRYNDAFAALKGADV